METFPWRCVLDTNVVIDFDASQCLDTLFVLRLTFIVPDFVLANEYLSVDVEYLKAMGLRVASLNSTQVTVLIALRSRHPRLSIYDLAAYVPSDPTNSGYERSPCPGK